MKKNVRKLSLSVLMVAIAFSGCSNKDLQVAELEKQLQSKTDTIKQQQENVNSKTAKIQTLQEKLAQSENSKTAEINTLKQKLSQSEDSKTAKITESSSNSNATAEQDTASLTPPNAQLGECYAKVLIPAEYATKTEKKLLTSKVENISVSKPTYKNVDYRILDKAESFKYIATPATYKCTQNRVMVQPEKITYKVIPATFKFTEEKVMISPAQQVWKKGKGPISKIDNQTGDIMCFIEQPAKYKTVKTKVVDEPARTEKIVTPAVYKYIKSKVIDQEASYEKVMIPATYKVVTVQELDTEASINKSAKEETYQTIQSTYMSNAEELKWEKILCETNTDANTIQKIQQALTDRNYNPGVIDGIYGSNTQKALNAFQIDNKLPSGALTLESLDALGIN
jgi:peptidoglycan hydrolase-like protein with peptidoglycan-binding domain